MGPALELGATLNSFSTLFGLTANPATSFFGSSNGTVMFTNNIVQLEASTSGQVGLASVFIVTLDHLQFANNQCWLDAPQLCALVDVFLFGVTIEVNSNRFQETLQSAAQIQAGAVNPVMESGVTFGILNITSANISTYCLLSAGVVQLVNPNNIVWYQDPEAPCERVGDAIFSNQSAQGG
jgi:hypothetical protein